MDCQPKDRVSSNIMVPSDKSMTYSAIGQSSKSHVKNNDREAEDFQAIVEQKVLDDVSGSGSDGITELLRSLIIALRYQRQLFSRTTG